MEGARYYAELFKTGQYGCLYMVSGSHARGKTFHIYVLPANEKAVENGGNNPPLNTKAVEVYGIIGGQPGWTEKYGWKHEGKWMSDFDELVKEAKRDRNEKTIKEQKEKEALERNKKQRDKELLDSYK